MDNPANSTDKIVTNSMIKPQITRIFNHFVVNFYCVKGCYMVYNYTSGRNSLHYFLYNFEGAWNRTG